MGRPLRVLLVEDSDDDARMLLRELRGGGYDPVHRQVETAEAFSAALAEREWDVIIADWRLPRFSAPAALAIAKQSGLDLPFLIMSGVVSEAEAVSAMKAGAHDYIRKGTPARLIPAIDRELREADLRRRNRRLEEALRQAQKMEILGRFAAHVASEFKEALVTINHSAALIAEQLPGSDAIHRELDQIQMAAQEAGLLTIQLLSLGQAQPAESALLDLNAIVSDRHEILRRILGNQIRLKIACDPRLGKVLSHQSQIEQVILNLVVNARDAMPRGGSISLETANAELDASYVPEYFQVKPGRYALLRVSDTGSGIPREIRGRIFEPFFTTKPKGRGTGMGLAFVYNIVKQNGGDIRVDSEPGRGAVFTIYLPQATTGAAARPAGARPASGIKARPTVLTAGGDEEELATAWTALADAGYTVLKARDGRTAKLIAKSYGHKIDLLLTPVVLPDMSGHDLASELMRLNRDLQVLYRCTGGEAAEAPVGPGQRRIDRAAGADALVDRIREMVPAAPSAVA